MFEYYYLIVGSGLFGATFAYRAKQAGKRCLVIDKRAQLGGNVYCDSIEGIHVHTYGAHIFHTSNKDVWDFVNSLVPFNRYTNCPVANYKGTLYNLPFNMNTFYQMWGVRTPEEAQEEINRQRAAISSALNGSQPQNLEEQALLLVGKDIYEKLIRGYTEKQWGRPCTELPAFIIRRLPLRFVYDNNYFNDPYQGIPIGGYNLLIEKLLDNIETRKEVNAFCKEHKIPCVNGSIDGFFGTAYLYIPDKTPDLETAGCLNNTDKKMHSPSATAGIIGALEAQLATDYFLGKTESAGKLYIYDNNEIHALTIRSDDFD